MYMIDVKISCNWCYVNVTHTLIELIVIICKDIY